jgi:tetratricopeptide (TPR) repeat protein
MDDLDDIRFLLDRKKTIIALERLREIHVSHVDNDEIYFLYCCCYKQLEKFHAARISIEKACELNPISSQNLVEYAGVELAFGNDDKALELLNNAIKINPYNEDAHTLK